MRKKFVKWIFITIMSFLVWKIAEYMFFSTEFELAKIGTLEDAVSTSCYIAKKETLIPAEVSGRLEPYFSEGERVPANAKIATILQGTDDVESQQRLTQINERIASIQSTEMFKDDLTQIEREIDRRVKLITQAVYENQYEKTSVLNSEISNLVDEMSRITNGDDTTNNLISQLTAEKNTLERKIGGLRHDIITPVSGVFSTNIDGFEETLNINSFSSFSVSLFNELDKINTESSPEVTVGQPACKIVDNFNWFGVFKIKENEWPNVAQGSSVLIRFPDFGNVELSCTIKSVSPAENKEKVVSFESLKGIQELIMTRRTNVDVIISRSTGIKVRKSALSKVGETEGVYIKSSTGVAFRPCKVVAKDEQYIIIEEGETSGKSVMVYDQVMIKGKSSLHNGVD